METFKKLFLLSAIFHFFSVSFAQVNDSIKSFRLSEVVVTATRTSGNTLELANSISVIDSIEIASKNVSNLSDLLNNEYGLSLTSQGGPGTLTNVYMRGSNTNYVLVLIDGVELNLNNDPGGVFDFSSFPVDNIERIEILRGPQSTLYGADAMAGVINIITKKGFGKPALSLNASGGSYKTYRLNALSNGSFERLNYSISLSRNGSDGFSAANEKYGNNEKDGYLKDQVISNIGFNFSDKIKNDFFFRFIKAKSDLDQSGKLGDDPTFVYNLEELNLSNETRINLFEDKWNQKLSLSFLRNVRKYKFDETLNNPASSRSLYDGRKYKIDWQNNIQLSENNLLSIGADFQYDEALSEYLYFSSFNYESLFPKVNTKIFGGYILEQIKIGESFFTSAGIRVDKHDKFGTSLTYQIAPAIMFWESGTKVKATIGTGYKAPSLFYLYDPAFGNSELKPEESLGVDFGFEQYFWKENLALGTTFFVNYFKEMFGFDPNTFKTININKAQTSGIEFFTQFKPLDNFYLKANYTFTKAFDKSEGVTAEDEPLLRRPEHKAGLFVSYDINTKINSSIEAIYVGKRFDKDFSLFPAERVTLNSYLILNLAASYKVTDFLQFFGRIENILDKEYEEVFGYGTPGISFYAGLSLNPFAAF
ncbi:MAG: TonB-dependent receptor [Ignavibacterium sp.]|uniref:TonB-dependent receptor plug domain-containing protein n=1 Tax=Ignavibacterium sp. TaxID=2651167 RepID=UPI0032997AD7